MTALVENPMPIIFFGIIAEAVLGVVLLRTGRGAILWVMLGVLVVVLAGVGLEWLVVTQAEEVEATLDNVAAALMANDLDRVFQHVAPEAQPSRSRARYAMGLFKLTGVKINNLKIKINRLTSPPSAKARFIGIISAEDPRRTEKGCFPTKPDRSVSRWSSVWRTTAGWLPSTQKAIHASSCRRNRSRHRHR